MQQAVTAGPLSVAGNVHPEPGVTDRPGGWLVACPDCASLHRLRAVGRGDAADCVTCGHVLLRGKPLRLDAALALLIAAAILFTVAHFLPFLTFSLEGREQQATLLTGVGMLWQTAEWPLAPLVLLAASVIPCLRLTGWLVALGSLRFARRPRLVAVTLRLVGRLTPWAMTEIFLLGVMVAYVKLSGSAELGLGVALPLFVASVILAIVGESLVEVRVLWSKVAAQAAGELDAATRLVMCGDCGQIAAAGPGGSPFACPRCAAALRRRKRQPLTRTAALVAAAAVLYVPANLLPILTVTYFGSGVPDTIASGVLSLLESGMVPIAILVFFASILVPVMKLLAFAWLLVSLWRGQVGGARQRTRLYRLVEGIGRWSMIDVFMISILVALVDLGSIATIEPGPGALCFAAVVVLTMIAAETFDPRVIWDVAERRGAQGLPARA